MNFVLRIYFLGLMAFVPSQDGHEATVLLLDARPGAVLLREHPTIEAHVPLLLARGICSGDCGAAQRSSIAQRIAPHLGASDATAQLESALQGGGAWKLTGTDLSINPPNTRSAPNDKANLHIAGRQQLHARSASADLELSVDHLEDFGLVTDLSYLVGDHGTVDLGLLKTGTSDPRIVARLPLTAGRLRTRTVFQVDNDIVPIEFRSSAQSITLPASADSAILDLEIFGPDIEIVAVDLASGCTRRMRLAPTEPGGVVEIALLNSPESSYDPVVVRQREAHPPQTGHHFALYYQLAENPSPEGDRPLPHLGSGERVANPVTELNPELQSDLLQALGLTSSRGAYDRIICPLAQLPAPTFDK